MMEDWIEHRRGPDGERLGWMNPVREGFVVIDLLGRERTDVVDWNTAEEFLDDLGIGYLADIYELRSAAGEWERVRITEVSTQSIRVKYDDGGAVGGPQTFFNLSFPISDELRVHIRRD
ncbi:MAG: hypothetical protein WBA28_08015 [Microbacteriaceae bacterium]